MILQTMVISGGDNDWKKEQMEFRGPDYVLILDLGANYLYEFSLWKLGELDTFQHFSLCELYINKFSRNAFWELHGNAFHIAETHKQSRTFCQAPLWTGIEYLYMLIYFATNHQRCFKTPSLWVLESCPKSQMIKNSLFSKLWQQLDNDIIGKTRSINLELIYSQNELWGTYLVRKSREIKWWVQGTQLANQW